SGSWGLVIGSSWVALSRIAPSSVPAWHGTDRSWPKRRPRPRGRETPRRQGLRGAGFLGVKRGQVKPLLFDLLVDVDFDRTGKERAPGLQIGLHAWVAGDALPVGPHELEG